MQKKVYLALLSLGVSSWVYTTRGPTIIVHDITLSPDQPPVEISKCALRAFWEPAKTVDSQADSPNKILFCHSGRDEQELHLYKIFYTGVSEQRFVFQHQRPHETILGYRDRTTGHEQPTMIVRGEAVHQLGRGAFMSLAMSDHDLIRKMSDTGKSPLYFINTDVATRLVWGSFCAERAKLRWSQQQGMWVATRCEKIETGEPVEQS